MNSGLGGCRSLKGKDLAASSPDEVFTRPGNQRLA